MPHTLSSCGWPAWVRRLVCSSRCAWGFPRSACQCKPVAGGKRTRRMSWRCPSLPRGCRSRIPESPPLTRSRGTWRVSAGSEAAWAATCPQRTPSPSSWSATLSCSVLWRPSGIWWHWSRRVCRRWYRLSRWPGSASFCRPRFRKASAPWPDSRTSKGGPRPRSSGQLWQGWTKVG